MLGLIGKKVGMTQVFDEAGQMVPVTVIQIEPNLVVEKRTPERNGYSAVLLGAGAVGRDRATKPYLGQFGEHEARHRLVEFREFDQECAVGDSLSVDMFTDVSYVDVVGESKGKGYQGVMKRHGFGGGRKTHGSKFHRANGSTGMAAWPSRVIKGTKMPGRMGGARTTVQNLRVVRVDAENQALLVRGAVPGKNNSYVVVSPAKKKGGLL
jgi:large subunit ribosomal protein L3